MTLHQPQLQKLPGAIGERFVLSGIRTVQPPQEEPFRVGDIFNIGPFTWRYRVIAVDGDCFEFERIL